MSEEVELLMDELKEGMEKSIKHLQDELIKIRTGKASPSMLGGLRVDYYGSPTPLNQVANVGAADAKTLTIQPWEKGMLAKIEKSIFEANLGLTPMNNGEIILINIPPLTEDRRRDLVKRAKALGEDAKVGLRSSRKKAMDFVKDLVKDGYPEDAGKRLENTVQDTVNAYGKKVDDMVDAKEKDIMTI
jgi:ribosome recycling factor